MTVAFINNGQTLRVVYSDGRVIEMFKPYSISTDETQGAIGVRNNMYAVQVNYVDVTAPISSSLSDLQAILQSWLSAPAYENSVSLSIENTDIAGQVMTSTPTPLGDYRFTYNLNDRFFSRLTNGAGAITHDTTDKAALLSVTNNNDYAIISTYQNHPYFAGYPIDAEFTVIDFHPQNNVRKEIIYGDRTFSAFTGKDGIVFSARDNTHYIEIWKSGTMLEEYPRSDWYDKMDGTGASGFNWGNFSTFCVFDIQWLWLGGAGVGLFAYANGHKYLLHIVEWSFLKSQIIISNPQKPLQAAIISTGGSGSFKFICSTVKTLGNPSLEVGEERSVYMANTGLSLSGFNALIGIRLRSAFRNSVIEPVDISVLPEGASDVIRWYLILNPTVTGTFTYGNSYGGYLASDCFEVALGTGATASGGTVVRASEAAGRSTATNPIKTPRKIGWTLDGVAETMVLCAENLSGGTVTVNASISIRQRY